MTAVSLEGVTYTYPGADAPALLDVSLEVAPGELVLVAGGSGSGKSSLLRAISGLVPHFHGGTFAGRATVAGMVARTMPNLSCVASRRPIARSSSASIRPSSSWPGLLG